MRTVVQTPTYVVRRKMHFSQAPTQPTAAVHTPLDRCNTAPL